MWVTYDKKKWIGMVALLVIAILSFSVGAKYAAAPEHHKETIVALDEKKDTVLELTVAATATSALITLLPGDVGTPIAEKVADLSGYLLIVLCAVFLEKYLVTLTGYAAFKLFIPAACVLFAGNLIFQNRSVSQLARRLLAFGICIFLVVPASVKLSDLIDDTYHAQIEMTLEEAKGTQKILESGSGEDAGMQQKENESTNKSENKIGAEQKESQGTGVTGLLEKAKGALGNAKDTVTSAVENVTLSSEELLQKIEYSLSRFVEAVAVMLITSCVIPILVLLVFFWLIKVLLDVDMSGSIEKAVRKIQK
ncbi:hypothetical protein [Brotaphodocola sp.]|uniref:hypothetical protein n=1 Tax=Brotaphodocola sp. TaxID=3073577 RepID=UPI003D7D8282